MNFNETREGLLKEVHLALPGHIERLRWDKDKLRQFQTTRLREILQIAREKSPYYREILKDTDLSEFNIEELNSLPVLKKQGVMDNWDDIIAVPGIKLHMAENHLEEMRQGKRDNPYFDNKYLFIATGGSSGKRGLFLWDSHFMKETACICYRYLADRELREGYTGPKKLAVVEAPSFLHGSKHLFTINYAPDVDVISLSSIDSAEKQIKTLNEYKPSYLEGFASVIAELAHYQLKGRLDIQPRWVSTNSEPLDDEMREIIRRAWGIDTCNSWGCVEIGMAAMETEMQTGMVIGEDVVILELVDNNLKPIKDKKDTRKVLATSLIQKSFPLIRYVIDDVLDIANDEAEYPAYRKIKSIMGRADDWFMYDKCRIHPMAFRSVLGQDKEIEEYQITQTPNGAEIKIVGSDKIDKDLLYKKIKGNLEGEGLKNPEIKFEPVQSLPRHPETGKVKRFIPLKK